MQLTRKKQISRFATIVETPTRKVVAVSLAITGLVGFLLLASLGQSYFLSSTDRDSGEFDEAGDLSGRVSLDPTITLSELQQTEPIIYDDSPTLGPAGAKVTIVEFGDLDSSASAQVQETIKNILSEFGGSVLYVWKDFPLTFHLEARAAANAARCAQHQDAFFEMQDYLLAFDGDLTAAILESAGTALGLDAEQYASCLTSQTYDDIIERDFIEAVDLQVTGTPYFFVNDVRIEGARTLDEFRDIINQALTDST